MKLFLQICPQTILSCEEVQTTVVSEENPTHLRRCRTSILSLFNSDGIPKLDTNLAQMAGLVLRALSRLIYWNKHLSGRNPS